MDKKSIFQLGCQPILKSFSDSLPVWRNPDLILYHFLRIIKFRVDVHFKHGAYFVMIVWKPKLHCIAHWEFSIFLKKTGYLLLETNIDKSWFSRFGSAKGYKISNRFSRLLFRPEISRILSEFLNYLMPAKFKPEKLTNIEEMAHWW